MLDVWKKALQRPGLQIHYLLLMKGDMDDKSLSSIIDFRGAALSDLDDHNDLTEDTIPMVKDKGTLGHLENCKEDIKQTPEKGSS